MTIALCTLNMWWQRWWQLHSETSQAANQQLHCFPNCEGEISFTKQASYLLELTLENHSVKLEKVIQATDGHFPGESCWIQP